MHECGAKREHLQRLLRARLSDKTPRSRSIPAATTGAQSPLRLLVGRDHPEGPSVASGGAACSRSCRSCRTIRGGWREWTAVTASNRLARSLPRWLTGTTTLDDRIERRLVGGAAATAFKQISKSETCTRCCNSLRIRQTKRSLSTYTRLNNASAGMSSPLAATTASMMSGLTGGLKRGRSIGSRISGPVSSTSIKGPSGSLPRMPRALLSISWRISMIRRFSSQALSSR
jgi:hypothetical protein